VNSAAIFNKKGVIDMPLDEWQRQIEIILTGAFLFTKHVASSMIEQRRKGSIINIVSTAGHQGEPNNIRVLHREGWAAQLHALGCDGTGLARDPRQQPDSDLRLIRAESLERAARWGRQVPNAERYKQAFEPFRTRVPMQKLSDSARLRARCGISRVGRRQHESREPIFALMPARLRVTGHGIRLTSSLPHAAECRRGTMEKSMEHSIESFIVDDQDAGLFRVNRKAFVDPECLQQERRRVFDKCWLYIGHESEGAARRRLPLANCGRAPADSGARR